MKIVISGASGFVGQELVPRLKSHELILLGRNALAMSEQFPFQKTASYKEICNIGKNADIFLHLATLNDDQFSSEAQYNQVNVDWMIEIINQAREAGIRRLINVSSTHALDKKHKSAYSKSKARGLVRLTETIPQAESIVLAAVYGDKWAGNLRKLNWIPPRFAKFTFGILKSLKPTTHVDLIVNHLESDKTAHNVIILTDEIDTNFTYKFLKRMMDICFAVGVLVLFGWLLIFLWGAVRIDSKGPGLFKQVRVGKNGHPFTLYKFRTMAFGTKQAGTHEISSLSITRVGSFLRRSKLDELPQIFNILKNDVSLVGPRPCLLSQSDLIMQRKKHNVLSVKPGITGLAQINDIDMSNPKKLALKDAEYVKLRSFILDLNIFLSTIFGKGRGDRIQS